MVSMRRNGQKKTADFYGNGKLSVLGDILTYAIGAAAPKRNPCEEKKRENLQLLSDRVSIFFYLDSVID